MERNGKEFAECVWCGGFEKGVLNLNGLVSYLQIWYTPDITEGETIEDSRMFLRTLLWITMK